MPKLNLGVIDLGYSDGDGATTTGDVAGYLEDRFHIMRIFAQENGQFIGDQLAEALAGAIETWRSVGEKGKIALDQREAMSAIEARFRRAIDSGEIARILPTKFQVNPETLLTNSRTESKKLETARAQFVDTELYRNSFRAWLSK